jgi:hypothetical protein
MIKYTPQFLKKLEEIFSENGYVVRYEKGNFRSGYCVLEDRKIIVVNKFSSLESRIGNLIEILRNLSAAQEFTGAGFEQLRPQLAKDSKTEEV